MIDIPLLVEFILSEATSMNHFILSTTRHNVDMLAKHQIV